MSADTELPTSPEATDTAIMSTDDGYAQMPMLAGNEPMPILGLHTDAYGNQLPAEHDLQGYAGHGSNGALMYMSPPGVGLAPLPFSPTMNDQGYGFNGSSDIGSPLMQHNPYEFLMNDVAALALQQQQQQQEQQEAVNGGADLHQDMPANGSHGHGGRRNYGNGRGGGGRGPRAGQGGSGAVTNGFYGFHQDSRQPFWVNYPGLYSPRHKGGQQLHVDPRGNLRGGLAPLDTGHGLSNGFAGQSFAGSSSYSGYEHPAPIGFTSPGQQNGNVFGRAHHNHPPRSGKYGQANLAGPFPAFSGFGYNSRGGGGGGDGGGSRGRYASDHNVVRSPLLEEFKLDKQAKRWETVNIFGHLVEFAGDQHGSRLVQQKLEVASQEDRERIFQEILPNAYAIMTDVFGNYVAQKMFEHGDQIQKARLAKEMEGKMLVLSMQMYGCRVVQKALEHVLVDQRERLMAELDGKIVECVKSNNANHVVQRMVSLNPPQSVPDSFVGVVEELSLHPYGCRVLQKIFECLPDGMKRGLLDELHESTETLILDQFGNYVVQSVITHCHAADRAKVIGRMKGRMLELSKHKFASNVVEKALVNSAPADRRDLVQELIGLRSDGTNNVAMLLKDAYANFPVQTALMHGQPEDRQQIFDICQPLISVIRHTPVGKRLERKLEEMTTREGFVPSEGVASGSNKESARWTVAHSGAASETGKNTSPTDAGTEVGTSTDMSRSGSNDTAVTTPEQRFVPLAKPIPAPDDSATATAVGPGSATVVVVGERLTRSLSATTPATYTGSLGRDTHLHRSCQTARSGGRDREVSSARSEHTIRPNRSGYGVFDKNNDDDEDDKRPIQDDGLDEGLLKLLSLH